MLLSTLSTLALALVLPGSAPALAPADSVRPDREVRLAVLRNASDVRHCYEAEGLPRNPALRGTLEIALTILPTGVVSEARVDSASLRGPGTTEVALCVIRHARNWRFERGPFRTETHLFPFRFVPEVENVPLGGRRSG